MIGRILISGLGLGAAPVVVHLLGLGNSTEGFLVVFAWGILIGLVVFPYGDV